MRWKGGLDPATSLLFSIGTPAVFERERGRGCPTWQRRSITHHFGESQTSSRAYHQHDPQGPLLLFHVSSVDRRANESEGDGDDRNLLGGKWDSVGAREMANFPEGRPLNHYTDTAFTRADRTGQLGTLSSV
ncbi:Hypothetical protein NTJ_05465 [Nesidiocoris tenuis]|uniref:Uncharacterized protein n=1 Tax=Nesidiocoris tenuis TaxID=355587 RepID=A0ABN7AP44_9HEMI|nr:Hypothetical protein NTJ_05465 [Nesidiocoris tenuis]